MSSIILLKIALKAEHLHAYATYKLFWQGFPVHVIGTTVIDHSIDMAYQFVTEKQLLVWIHVLHNEDCYLIYLVLIMI